MHDKLTDIQLVERTLGDDVSAFGILVNRYRGLVYGLAYHVVGSFQDAEDIAQETFIKAYDNLFTLKDKAKFGGWLRVITLNLCKMWLRKSVKESLFETSSLQSEEYDEETISSFREDDIDSSLATNVTPEDICINKEFQETIFTVLSTLPPKSQAVITLFYLNDLSYKEIGDFLNLPVSTVQSRLQRARKQLKEEFLKMAKEIFQDNRLGAKFTQKVLDEIMAEGRKHLDAEKWDEAEAKFLKAIEMKPDHLKAYFHVAKLKGNQELYEEAAEWYQKAAELKPVSKEEEIQLFQKAKQGDLEARDTIIIANLPLMASIAKEYVNCVKDCTFDDLMQEEGSIGLLNAVGQFDYRKGDKFSTYATWWIRQALNSSIIAAAYANRGAALATKGEYAEAVATYKEAIQRFDELQGPRYIKYRLSRGEHLEIIDAFEDFVSQNPEDAEAYYCLACLYSSKADDSKASEALEKAARLDSSYHEKAKTSKFFVPAKTEQCAS